MAYVVLENCIACRYGDCAAVCPQGAFRQGPNFAVIDPAACANCGLCEIVCPVAAIKPDWGLTEHELTFKALNAELASHWPATTKMYPLEKADEFRDRPEKLRLLQRN